MTKGMRENLVSYTFLAPFLLVFVIFLAYPVFYSAWISLHKTTIYTSWYYPFSEMKFAGFENYTSLLLDFELWWSFFLTICYGFLTIPTGIFLSLLLAVLLDNKLKGKSFFRSAFFLPNVLDLFVVGVIWILIFAPEFGLLDILLKKIGLGAESGPVFEKGLLGNAWTCLPAIAVAMVLKGAGFGMILFLTAIQNISQSVYEAADIDGAGWWHKFRHITIPLVKPIILFMVITGTISCLTAFTEVYAMTINTGGPTANPFGHSLRAANLLGYHLYRNFQDAYYGKAAALSFIILAFASLISWINIRIIQPRRK